MLFLSSRAYMRANIIEVFVFLLSQVSQCSIQQVDILFVIDVCKHLFAFVAC